MSDELAQVQAAVEGVTVAQSVEFMGESFRISDRVGLMPLMKFAHAASSGMDTSDMRALAATYEMLRDCIAEADWEKFERHAVETKADADDLLKVVQQTIETLTARPTTGPSGSSPTPLSTSGNSTVSSSAAPGAASNGSPPGKSAISSSRR